MLLLIALAGGTGAFAYAYAQLRQIRIETVHRAETVARIVARVATALARLIDLLADVLRLLTASTAGVAASTRSRPLTTDAEADAQHEEDNDW